MTNSPSHQASEREEVARLSDEDRALIERTIDAQPYVKYTYVAQNIVVEASRAERYARTIARKAVRQALALQAEGRRELVELVGEAFLAGWEACERKWEGPSAAGYPTDPDAALELYELSALSKASGGSENQELSSARRSQDRGCAGPAGQTEAGDQ